jgi:hypothetical protein
MFYYLECTTTSVIQLVGVNTCRHWYWIFNILLSITWIYKPNHLIYPKQHVAHATGLMVQNHPPLLMSTSFDWAPHISCNLLISGLAKLTHHHMTCQFFLVSDLSKKFHTASNSGFYKPETLHNSKIRVFHTGPKSSTQHQNPGFDSGEIPNRYQIRVLRTSPNYFTRHQSPGYDRMNRPLTRMETWP